MSSWALRPWFRVSEYEYISEAQDKWHLQNLAPKYLKMGPLAILLFRLRDEERSMVTEVWVPVGSSSNGATLLD